MKIPIIQIKVNEGRRETDPAAVKELAGSISEIGLMNAITVDREYTLIAGLHRLEAAKLLGWTEIECTVSSLEGLLAELAEIDENLIRRGLDCVEEGEQYVRRKEIYEMLHPETQQGKRNGQTSKTDTGSVLEAKSFAQDTAEKIGVSPRTIERKVQIAKKLTPETKEIVKNNNLGFRNALRLSRLPSMQQKEAANMIVANKTHSVDEYQPTAERVPDTAPQNTERKETAIELAEEEIRSVAQYQSAPADAELPEPEPDIPLPPVPYTLGDKHYASLEESIADLKNHDKDARYTPDVFLADITGFVSRFHKEFIWYSDPFCMIAYPDMTQEQLNYLKQQLDSICDATKKLLNNIERTASK